MRTETIIYKKDKKYKVEIDESSFEHKMKENEHESWKVRFKIFDEEGFAGQGFFEINIRSKKEYLTMDMLELLIKKGVSSLKERIDKGEDIASVGFHFN